MPGQVRRQPCHLGEASLGSRQASNVSAGSPVLLPGLQNDPQARNLKRSFGEADERIPPTPYADAELFEAIPQLFFAQRVTRSDEWSRSNS